MAMIEKIEQKALAQKRETYGPDYQRPVKTPAPALKQPYKRTDLSAIEARAHQLRAEHQQKQQQATLKNYPGIQHILKPPMWGSGARSPSPTKPQVQIWA
jgi:hypothetical protein